MLADGVPLLAAQRPGKDVVPAKEEKERTKLGRAPLVIVVGAVHRGDDTVPFVEQFAAAAAAVTEHAARRHCAGLRLDVAHR